MVWKLILEPGSPCQDAAPLLEPEWPPAAPAVRDTARGQAGPGKGLAGVHGGVCWFPAQHRGLRPSQGVRQD